MTTLKSLCLLLLMSCTISCNGQNKSEGSNNHPNEAVAYASGDIVTSSLLDREGNMWFTTTTEGVFRYDGTSFTNYTESDGLCGEQVWSVIEDQEGVLWFGTMHGLCRYNPNDQQASDNLFHNIPLPDDYVTSDWLKQGYPIINPQGIIGLIQDKKGIFWIGSNGGGAYRYDPGSENPFTSILKNKGNRMPDSLYHNVITSITEDRTGNIWFSSFSHGGVSKYDGDTFTHYGIEDGLGDDMISTSYLDQKGRMWFGTRSGGMSVYDGKAFTTIKEPEGSCENNMASLFEDRLGTMWMASYARSGVCTFDGTTFTPFEVEGSQNLVDIKFISEDAEGNLWFGGRYGILWRYDGAVLKDFTHLKRV